MPYVMMGAGSSCTEGRGFLYIVATHSLNSKADIHSKNKDALKQMAAVSYVMYVAAFTFAYIDPGCWATRVELQQQHRGVDQSSASQKKTISQNILSEYCISQLKSHHHYIICVCILMFVFTVLSALFDNL